jgi:hypothetical protein
MDDEKRDGVSWFDDQLWTVASHAAVEIDFIRIGKTVPNCSDWHVRVLGRWFLDRSRVTGDPLFHLENFYSLNFLGRLARHRKVVFDTNGPTPSSLVLRVFAREMGEALFQAIHFDPTFGGWTRPALVAFCCDVSRLAVSDEHYGRSAQPGAWRGVSS